MLIKPGVSEEAQNKIEMMCKHYSVNNCLVY